MLTSKVLRHWCPVFVGNSQTGQTSESAQNREEEPEKEEGGFFSKLKKMFS